MKYVALRDIHEGTNPKVLLGGEGTKTRLSRPDADTLFGGYFEKKNKQPRQYSSVPAGVSMGSAIGRLTWTRMALIISPSPPKPIRQIKQDLEITFSLRYPTNLSYKVLKSWSLITVTSKHILKCVRASETSFQ